jgi:hypothetical protein
MKTNETKPTHLQAASITARERKEHTGPRLVRNSLRSLSSFVAMLFLLLLPAAVQAQFTYTTNNGTITITGGCPSSPGTVTIPSTINGLPVTRIGSQAFWFKPSLAEYVTDIAQTNTPSAWRCIRFGKCLSFILRQALSGKARASR